MGFDGVELANLVCFCGFYVICDTPEFAQKHMESRLYSASAHEIPNRFLDDLWDDHFETGIWVLMVRREIWNVMGR